MPVYADYGTQLSHEREFEKRFVKYTADAMKTARRRDHLPPGWVGGWRDAWGPKGVRVRFNPRARSGAQWILTRYGIKVSAHGSRPFAISAGKRQINMAKRGW